MGKALLSFILLLSLMRLDAQVSIGSKNFPESSLLAEIMAQTIEANTDLEVERRFGLGGTLICFEALKTGEIDIYPEYSGTIKAAILKDDLNLEEIESRLQKEFKISVGPLFGFSNNYVLITYKNDAIKKISDLRGRTDLNYGFSNEFVQREDGFPGLNHHYNLEINQVSGLEHGLAYQALREGKIDITDAYSTDGKLGEGHFTTLDDDNNFFPDYKAVPLLNAESIKRFPQALEAFQKLENLIDEKTMRELNMRVEVLQEDRAEVAHDFLKAKGIVATEEPRASLHPVLRQTLEHIHLSLLGTLLAVLIAVPLGIYITAKPQIAGAVMSITGTIQTIPSLALLGFMIPLFGIGFLPAVIALFLYALLPILRNTSTGLGETDPILIEAGRAMGMTEKQILFQLRLPLASSMIMAGIRTALTINIGTATLAAFIGAGGLGESIITGITLNNHEMILQGAIPAALLALLADQIMKLVQKKLSYKSV